MSVLIGKAAELPSGDQKASLGDSVWYPNLIFKLDVHRSNGTWTSLDAWQRARFAEKHTRGDFGFQQVGPGPIVLNGVLNP